jgi:hypothetical protein
MVGNSPASAVRVLSLLMLALAICLAGCSPAEKIEQYQVEKPDVLAEKYFPDSPATRAASSGTDRMLAAIVPHGSQFWFFKLAGPDEVVASHGEEFLKFMLSLHFAEGADSPPQWTLPEGWKRLPGNEVRYATLEIDPTPPPLGVSVTTLPKPPEEDATKDAVLSNVNRWRGQMGLSSISQDELAKQTKPLKLGGETATLVSLVGKLGKGMGKPPFAGGGPFTGGALPPGHPDLPPDHPQLPPDHPAIPNDNAGNAEKPPAESPADLTFKTPDGWKPGRLSEMRKAAFVVENDSRKVEITVVALPPFAGDLLSNVNRWRGQLHLPEATADELTKLAKPVSIDGITGSYIELVGPADPAPQQSLLGAMAAASDKVWFITLRGDSKLAEREKPKFESFLKSIKFAAK